RPLLLRPPLVDEAHDRPVAGEDVAGDVTDEDEVEPGDVEVANLPPLDAVRDDREALTQIRVLADPARAVDVARAGLDQRPLQRVDVLRLRAALLRRGHSSSFRRNFSNERRES